jgi:hypothetical protein
VHTHIKYNTYRRKEGRKEGRKERERNVNPKMK